MFSCGLLPPVRRVVFVQILCDFLRVTFGNRRTKCLHHFLHFRIPRRRRQRRLHRDVPWRMATAAINLRLGPPRTFRESHFKRRVLRHTVKCVVARFMPRRLRNLPKILRRISTQLVLHYRDATNTRRPNHQTQAKCAKFHRRSPHSAAPTTNSCRSILFHKYPPAFHAGSSGWAFPFSSVARTASETVPGVFGVQARSQVRNQCAPKSSPSCAGFHVFKSSSEMSTFVTRPYPLNAVPRNVTPIPAGILPLPSGEIKNDRTGIRPIGTVFTPPAFIASGVVVPRGVSGIRYAVFIQKFSSDLSSTRIHVRHFIQYVAKYPGTTSRTGKPFNIGSGSPFIA